MIDFWKKSRTHIYTTRSLLRTDCLISTYLSIGGGSTLPPMRQHRNTHNLSATP